MFKHLNYLYSTVHKANPKSQAALSKPQLPNKIYEYINFRPYALALVQQLDIYLSSNKHSTKFKTDLIMFQYSSFCLHMWLLKNRIQKQSLFSLKKVIIQNSLNSLHQQYTKNHVFMYDDVFNAQVYYELQRLRQTIFWSLDDYYKFNFKQKPLEQIINEDICIEQNEPIQQVLKEYIPKHVRQTLFRSNRELTHQLGVRRS